MIPPLPAFPRAFWVEPGRLLGGPYPGDRVAAKATAQLCALLDVGVRTVICLQPPEERGHGGARFLPYTAELERLAAERGVAVSWFRHPIPDWGVTTPENVRLILRCIDESPDAVYLHCWGGHGRTGTIAGVWLRERGLSADEAFERLRVARLHDAHMAAESCPQSEAQKAMVRGWSG